MITIQDLLDETRASMKLVDKSYFIKNTQLLNIIEDVFLNIKGKYTHDFIFTTPLNPKIYRFSYSELFEEMNHEKLDKVRNQIYNEVFKSAKELDLKVPDYRVAVDSLVKTALNELMTDEEIADNEAILLSSVHILKQYSQQVSAAAKIGVTEEEIQFTHFTLQKMMETGSEEEFRKKGEELLKIHNNIRDTSADVHEFKRRLKEYMDDN